ncbi:MAG: CinA family nicotinamide mononucleotide deamidase-related protein, partial [Elusimicrobia bacterium]|nr:CinA family nicotinamide mononucleotide deamidase-related protein [Elusimicrobiota bacterium]
PGEGSRRQGPRLLPMKVPPQRLAEAVCVGSELLSGRVDTHTSHLASRLPSASLRLARSTAVPDDLPAVRDAVFAAAARADAVLVFGGLGPTFDDITREAVAAAFGRKLVYRPALYAAILRRYARYRLRVPSNNRRQAFLIEGARALDNPNGSAPGQALESPWGTPVFLLPGPPAEMYPMLARRVLPELTRRFGAGLASARRVFRFYGVAEAACDQRLRPVMARHPDVSFTILADLGLVELHAAARARSARDAVAALDRLERGVAAAMGDAYYSREGESLPDAVGNLLKNKGWRLAVAESCTGGLIAGQLTTVPGSSDWFLGGAVAYSNALKTSLLGVETDLLARHGAVSEETARAMALGACSRLGAEAGLAVTGVAGPGGGTKAKPVGLVYLAAAVPGRVEVVRRLFPGNREQVRRRTVAHALGLLRALCRRRSP